EFYSTNITHLSELKKRWGVSMTAIVKRAEDLDILSQESVTSFYRRNPRIKSKEPLDDQILIETPSFPKNGLKAILDADLVSVEYLKSQLPFNDRDLEEIFCQEKDFYKPPQNELANIIEFKPL